MNVDRYMPLVRSIAAKIARRTPPNVSIDDLIGAGCEGLLRALKSGEDRGDSFKVYLAIRIRGAMIDELRTMDWLGRRHREQGIAEPLMLGDDTPEVAMEEDLSPERLVGDKEQIEQVLRLAEVLPARTREAFVRYHLKEDLIESIAADLRVSEPRVTQLHRGGLEEVRALALRRRGGAPDHCLQPDGF